MARVSSSLLLPLKTAKLPAGPIAFVIPGPIFDRQESDAVKQVGMVVEGINALPAAMKLIDKYHVEMPIITMVNEVVNDKIDPLSAVNRLMEREKKNEVI